MSSDTGHSRSYDKDPFDRDDLIRYFQVVILIMLRCLIMLSWHHKPFQVIKDTSDAYAVNAQFIALLTFCYYFILLMLSNSQAFSTINEQSLVEFSSNAFYTIWRMIEHRQFIVFCAALILRQENSIVHGRSNCQIMVAVLNRKKTISACTSLAYRRTRARMHHIYGEREKIRRK